MKKISTVKKVEKTIEKNKSWNTGLPKFDAVPDKKQKMWVD